MFQILKILRPRGKMTTNINNYSQSATLTKLKKLQGDFQCENGKPVWLKKGFPDRVLYCTTLVLSGIGLLMNLIVIYDNAKPNSWKTTTIC